VRKGVVLVVLALVGTGCAGITPVERAAQLVRMHREPEAIATLQKELAKHPDDIAARRFYVRVLAFSGDIAAAEREVHELERRLPNDPAPWIELGHAYELVHRFEEALEAYDKASAVAPSSPIGPLEGGKRAARWGELEEAAPRLEEAIRRGSRDPETFHVLGLVRLNQGELEAATAAYKEGLAIDPKSTENILGLASVAVVRGDAAAALSAYDAIAAQKPSFASAQLGRAWALGKLGRRAEAEKAILRATELGAPAASVEAQRRALAAASP
jgi:Flp pilus assembly protein TadD